MYSTSRFNMTYNFISFQLIISSCHLFLLQQSLSFLHFPNVNDMKLSQAPDNIYFFHNRKFILPMYIIIKLGKDIFLLQEKYIMSGACGNSKIATSFMINTQINNEI